MFFIQKLVNNNLVKNNHLLTIIYSKTIIPSSLECLAGHLFPKFHRSFRLTHFPPVN